VTSFGATLLRIGLGATFVLHGYYGYFNLNPTTVGQIVSVGGVPLGDALAWYTIVAQIAGGLMLIVGLWTRWAALANVPVLLAAVFLFHSTDGFFMTAVVDAARGPARVTGLEYPLVVLIATVSQALLGGGAWAMTVDRA
jgi:putative oxidoreductase